MKYFLFLLVLADCTEYREVSSNGTHVNINGKDCELIMIDQSIRFVDCGPGSTSVTVTQGKTQNSTGSFVPPPVVPTVPATLPLVSPDGGARDFTCVCKANLTCVCQ